MAAGQPARPPQRPFCLLGGCQCGQCWRAGLPPPLLLRSRCRAQSVWRNRARTLRHLRLAPPPLAELSHIPTLLYGTINGVIGVIASLPQPLYALLDRLQVGEVLK